MMVPTVPIGSGRILEDDNGKRMQDGKTACGARGAAAGRRDNVRDADAGCERPR